MTGDSGNGRRGRPRLVQRVDLVEQLCRGRSVLHLGCTDSPYTASSLRRGSLLHSALAAVSGELWGLDADEEAIDLLRRAGFERLLQGDLERLDDCAIDRSFDVVLAGEVIEHLSNPGLFLEGARRLVAPGGLLVVTTVNAYCAFRMAQYAFRGRGGENEPVHADHVAYYSGATLRGLLRRFGWRVEELSFYDLGREHHASVTWRVRALNALVVRRFPQLADGLVALCRPS